MREQKKSPNLAGQEQQRLLTIFQFPGGAVRLEMAKQIQETDISFPYFLICTAWKRPLKAKINSSQRALITRNISEEF